MCAAPRMDYFEFYDFVRIYIFFLGSFFVIHSVYRRIFINFAHLYVRLFPVRERKKCVFGPVFEFSSNITFNVFDRTITFHLLFFLNQTNNNVLTHFIFRRFFSFYTHVLELPRSTFRFERISMAIESS